MMLSYQQTSFLLQLGCWAINVGTALRKQHPLPHVCYCSIQQATAASMQQKRTLNQWFLFSKVKKARKQPGRWCKRPYCYSSRILWTTAAAASQLASQGNKGGIVFGHYYTSQKLRLYFCPLWDQILMKGFVCLSFINQLQLCHSLINKVYERSVCPSTSFIYSNINSSRLSLLYLC